MLFELKELWFVCSVKIIPFELYTKILTYEVVSPGELHPVLESIYLNFVKNILKFCLIIRHMSSSSIAWSDEHIFLEYSSIFRDLDRMNDMKIWSFQQIILKYKSETVKPPRRQKNKIELQVFHYKKVKLSSSIILTDLSGASMKDRSIIRSQVEVSILLTVCKTDFVLQWTDAIKNR